MALGFTAAAFAQEVNPGADETAAPSRLRLDCDTPPWNRATIERRRFFVSPTGDDWVLQRVGQEQPVARFDTQGEAIEAGRFVARAMCPSQLFIQRPNGQLREERTYGDDPEDTPG